MKKIYALAVAAVLTPALASATIVHEDFGTGMVFDANANIALDVNNDGTTDFYVNTVAGELGFEPIFAVGCYGTTSTYVGPNSYDMQTFQNGEEISMTSTYFEETRPSSIAVNGNPALGWADNQEQMVGFMIFNTGAYGWMNIKMNLATNQLVILEWAYTTDGSNLIEAGDRGFGAPNTIPEVDLADMKMYPNPATDQITLEMASSSEVTLEVFNNVGQVIFTQKFEASALVQKHTIVTSTWAKGQYILRIRNDKTTVTEKISVVK